MASGSDGDSGITNETAAPVIEKVKTPVAPRRTNSSYRQSRTAANNRLAAPVIQDSAKSVPAKSSNGANGNNGHDNVDKFFA